MGYKQGFQLRRRHLEAFVFDQFLETIDDEDLVVVIDETYIAGVQPSIFVNYALRGLFVVEVSCSIQPTKTYGTQQCNGLCRFYWDWFGIW